MRPVAAHEHVVLRIEEHLALALSARTTRDSRCAHLGHRTRRRIPGVEFGRWLADMPVSVSVSAAVGFIALIGQAALNGVLVTSAIA